MLLNALQSLAVLMLLMALGFWAAGKEWFQGGSELLSTLLVKLIMPFNVLLSILDHFSGVGDWRSFLLMVACVVGMMSVGILVGWLFSALLKVRQDRRGIFISSTAFPNIVLLGFPFVESVYGAEAMGYAVNYFLVNTLYFWTVCPLVLSRFSNDSDGSGFRLANLRKCLSPSLVAALVGIVLLATGLPLPEFVVTPMRKLSQCSTGLSMLFVGGLIRGSRLRVKTVLNRDVMMLLALKMIVVMAVLIILLRWLPIPLATKKVFLLLTAMPACVNLSLLAHQYRCDYGFCAIVSTVMNVICVLCVPIYIFLFELVL